MFTNCLQTDGRTDRRQTVSDHNSSPRAIAQGTKGKQSLEGNTEKSDVPLRRSPRKSVTSDGIFVATTSLINKGQRLHARKDHVILAQAAVPIVKALDHIQQSASKDKVLKGHLSDAFKL
ncbi:hypothetical protein DPMN_000228 [Dreissena polymorpha]|uniref:Uncharacterized protein n=1 Tax=Dreissena polymorpha TaxID=45954 RepID=A0A9D4RRI0_DREPO|nr:hypothetical protein DPMN_000228 [Dreissena polymorpha]